MGSALIGKLGPSIRCTSDDRRVLICHSVNMYASTWICTKISDVAPDAAIRNGPAANLEEIEI